MKIRVLDSVGEFKIGDIVDAAVNLDKTCAVALDEKNTSWVFNVMCKPRFEIVKDENQEIIDRVEKAIENIDEIKVYGNKYTLSELKELKELFKC